MTNKDIFLLVVSILFLVSFLVNLLWWQKQVPQDELPAVDVKTERNLVAEKALLDQIETLPPSSSACFPTFKQVCENGSCKTPSELGTTFTLVNNLNERAATIARCDAKGCDVYDALYDSSGLYENYAPKQPRGFLLKKESSAVAELVETDITHYFEVATLGTAGFIYSGYCKDNK